MGIETSGNRWRAKDLARMQNVRILVAERLQRILTPFGPDTPCAFDDKVTQPWLSQAS